MINISGTETGSHLLPCPFCGGEGALTYTGEEYHSDPFEESWSVFCNHCAAGPPCDFWDKARAEKQWNTRTDTVTCEQETWAQSTRAAYSRA